MHELLPRIRPLRIVELIGRCPPLLTLLAILFTSPVLAQSCPAEGCDDGNPCTDDLCDAKLGCRHYNNAQVCSDGNSCTTTDACNSGVCVGGNVAEGCSVCGAVADLPAAGGVFSGVTSGTGTMKGSCHADATGPERVYRWVPRTSGRATLSTCGAGTDFDTVLYLRNASCTGSQVNCNDDATGCPISSGAVHGSRLAVNVTAGNAYYIVVDGFNGKARGNYTLTVQEPQTCGNGLREGTEACDGSDNSACATKTCTSRCACALPNGGQADLRPEITDWQLDRNTTADPGDVAEGCAESTSAVDLLRFGVTVHNDGAADLIFGNPGCPECSTSPLAACVNPDFICSPSAGHNHPHYSNYARYELLDASSQTVVTGHKQGFCLMDIVCPTINYTCNYQGITAGCADIYRSDLGCQYIDVTGVPPGDYTLKVTVDPFSRIAEANESNNVVTQLISIPDPDSTSCTSAQDLPSAGGTFTGATSGVGTQSGPCASTSASPERAYRWTAPASGVATISTCGSGFDTVLYMRGDDCQSGVGLSCNDNVSGCSGGGSSTGSRITPTVTAGRTYYIFVDGKSGARGTFTLNVTPPTAPACSIATTIPAAGGIFTGTTSGSSTAGPACNGALTANSPEKVFQWTPTRSGTALITTCGSSFDTTLYMSARTCDPNTRVGCSNNYGGCAAGGVSNWGSRLAPTVTAGTTYYIFVDGNAGARGDFRLNVTPPP
jgi:hypothetical protein